jgi:hypothetical protein
MTYKGLEIYDRSKLSSSTTGLPNGIQVWVQDRTHFSHLTVQVTRVTSGTSMKVSVSENPVIVSGNGMDYSFYDKVAIFNWVRLNQDALARLAGEQIGVGGFLQVHHKFTT